MPSRFTKLNPDGQPEAKMPSYEMPRPRRYRRTTDVVLRLFTVYILLTMISLLMIGWLTTKIHVQSIQAQEQVGAANIEITSFPQLTVGFDCNVSELYTNTFLLYEDDLLQAVDKTDLMLDGPSTQVAIFLDLFRDRDSKLPSAMQELLAREGETNDLIDYLKEFGDQRNPTYITAGRDSLGIFVPDRDLVTPRTILATNNFTYDVNSLIQSLSAIRTNDPRSARLTTVPTTGLVDSLLQLLGYFDDSPAKQRVIVVFSDGTDEISSPENRMQLIAGALERGILIYTAFVATSTPGDPDFLRLLAEQTGGQVVAAYDEDHEQINAGYPLRELLPDLFPKPPHCQIHYQTTQASPRQVALYDVDNNQIATGIVPKITLVPPTVTIDSMYISPLVNKSINATLTLTVHAKSNYLTELPRTSDRRNG